MKFPTVEQQKAHQQAVIAGGSKGLLGGLAFAVPMSFVVQRRWAYYRSLPPNLKAFAGVVVVVPATIIAAERASLAYEKSQWEGEGKAELDTIQSRDEARWETLSATGKAVDFARRHPFSLIGGSWAASVAGAYSWISRDPLQTTFQKVTATRVWAQGLTLGILISAAALLHSGQTRAARVDHSWKDIIEHEQAEKEARRSRKV